MMELGMWDDDGGADGKQRAVAHVQERRAMRVTGKRKSKRNGVIG